MSGDANATVDTGSPDSLVDSSSKSVDVPPPRRAEVPLAPAGLVGSLVADRYLVHELLGVGGMGEVYAAEHVHMKKRVALKVLHPEMSQSPEVVARFEREAVAAGRIQHPSVVTATDFGRLPDGAFYLVLEFVEGKSLADVLRDSGPFSPARTFGVLIQIAAALQAAHDAGIVHRDLKPDNVMLVHTGEDDDFVKVLDFGIAKVLAGDTSEGEPALTRAGMLFGTPEYMSPEQARGEVVDQRTDLYSLGMIGYEMLTGKTAFASEDMLSVLRAQMLEEPAPLPSDVPPAFARLILGLLKKEPAERPGTAAELLGDFSALGIDLGFPAPTARTSAGTRLDITGRGTTLTDGVASRYIPLRPFQELRSLSMRPVSIGPKKVPLWVPSLALCLGLAVGFSLMRGGAPEVPVPAPVDESALRAKENRFLDAVRGGDRTLIGDLRKQLEQEDAEYLRSGAQRSSEAKSLAVTRYLALGRGYSEILLHTASIEAYEKAVTMDPHVAEESLLLVDVRTALLEKDAVEAALAFAEGRLGVAGADLVYDVWKEGRGQPGMTAVISRLQKSVRSQELREHASPALGVALDLERAKVCAEYREILTRAAEQADQRSSPKLEALRARKGCGFVGTQDCFTCLRDREELLVKAIERARVTKAPALVADNVPRSASR